MEVGEEGGEHFFFSFFVGGCVGCVMWFVSSFFGAIRF